MKFLKYLLFSFLVVFVFSAAFADQHDKCNCQTCKCHDAGETCGCDKQCDHCKKEQKEEHN